MRFGHEVCERCENYVNKGPNWVPYGDTYVNEGDVWECRLGFYNYDECKDEIPVDELPSVAAMARS